mmetsp:Transcript_42803/g.56555  ORF Transcript_42803/g.56555 Transcript_42803/m.56555 type:complete len:145 (+) Transcript_42803:1722-2156(+)
MLDTEESSSDEDANWAKMESKNPYLRLMALGKAKTVMNQYLLQDIDGLDVKLLFGCYQRKVLGFEERSEHIDDVLEKILVAKKQARQLAALIPDKTPLPPLDNEAPKTEAPPTKLDLIDKYARNADGLNVAEKSYLAQFYIKPN